jgi:hypothetical protein
MFEQWRRSWAMGPANADEEIAVAPPERRFHSEPAAREMAA